MRPYSPRHAPQSRFQYWRRRLDQAEQEKLLARLTRWPEERLARQSLDVAFVARTGSRYMQRRSIRGKSVYAFHRKSHYLANLPLGGLNVIHLLDKHEYDNASG